MHGVPDLLERSMWLSVPEEKFAGEDRLGGEWDVLL